MFNERMPSIEPTQETIENIESEEKSLKERITKSLKKIAMLGVATGSLLLSSFSSEAQTVGNHEKAENNIDGTLIKSKIDKMQFDELKKLDRTVDSLSSVLFSELKEKNLIQFDKGATDSEDDDTFTYKNWYFQDHDKDKFVVTGWKDVDEEGKVKEGYQYMDLGGTIPYGDMLHYIDKKYNGEGLSAYFYSGNQEKGGEIWKSKGRDIVEEEKSHLQSADQYAELSSSFKTIKEKLEGEIASVRQ